jgi:hypothetical protein
MVVGAFCLVVGSASAVMNLEVEMGRVSAVQNLGWEMGV